MVFCSSCIVDAEIDTLYSHTTSLLSKLTESVIMKIIWLGRRAQHTTMGTA